MKKIIKQLSINNFQLLIAFISVAFSPSICNSQEIAEQQIVGEWIFDFETSLIQMSEGAKNHYENLDPNHKANIQEAYQNRRLTFGTDGKFLQELANGTQADGFWRPGKNNSIEISSPDGRIIIFKIIEINEVKVILIPIKSDERAANMLFSEWHLIKV